MTFAVVEDECNESSPVSPERRRNMAAVRNANTTPEIRVRKFLHAAGYRFRLHRRDLPGTPDIVMQGRRLAIFVHGCFWHRHDGCPRSTTPKTRVSFWRAKFKANVRRDEAVRAALEELGWRVVVVWECETRQKEDMMAAFRGILAFPKSVS